jgi:hypothetical protein
MLVSATVAATITAASCNWNNPGADPYRGPIVKTTVAALERYGFSDSDKSEIVEKVRMLQPDALVTITRNGLHSHQGIAKNFRDMHYGNGSGKARVCPGEVIRDSWKDTDAESAMVYCSVNNNCIIIPIICGNVARVDFQFNPKRERQLQFWEGPIEPKVYSIDAPSSIWMVALGFVLMTSRLRSRAV